MENQVAEFVELVEHPNYEILTIYPFTIRRKDNHYEVSNIIGNRNYIYVKLNDNGNKKMYFKHILIAKQFIPNDDPEHKIQVDHKNKNTSDYHLENLRWCTPRENNRNISSKNGVIYEFVKEIPEDAIVVDTYNNHTFEDYYFHDDVFYFYTGIEYRILPINYIRNMSAFVNMKSIEDKRVRIYYSIFKRQHDLI